MFPDIARYHYTPSNGPYCSDCPLMIAVWGGAHGGVSQVNAALCRETEIAARQFLPLNCLAVTLTAGKVWKRKRCPLLWVKDSLGGILGDNLGEGNCESKNCLETMGRQFLPRDIKMSRRASGKVSGRNWRVVSWREVWLTRARWLAGSFACPRPIPTLPTPLLLFPCLLEAKQPSPPTRTRCQTPTPRTPVGTRAPLRKLPPEKSTLTLWHEISTKIILWEYFFGICEGFWALEKFRKERLFEELRVKFVISEKIFQNTCS